jgi:uncharacterized protein (DUF302 family)
MANLVVVPSTRSFHDTLDALSAAIDQRAGAAEAGLPLRPTTVVLFGAAKAGTPLMQAHQTLGLDLPLRALVYEAEDGAACIAYREPADILAAQGVAADPFPAVAAMSALLAAVAREAAAD